MSMPPRSAAPAGAAVAAFHPRGTAVCFVLPPAELVVYRLDAATSEWRRHATCRAGFPDVVAVSFVDLGGGDATAASASEVVVFSTSARDVAMWRTDLGVASASVDPSVALRLGLRRQLSAPSQLVTSALDGVCIMRDDTTLWFAKGLDVLAGMAPPALGSLDCDFWHSESAPPAKAVVEVQCASNGPISLAAGCAVTGSAVAVVVGMRQSSVCGWLRDPRRHHPTAIFRTRLRHEASAGPVAVAVCAARGATQIAVALQCGAVRLLHHAHLGKAGSTANLVQLSSWSTSPASRVLLAPVVQSEATDAPRISLFASCSSAAAGDDDDDSTTVDTTQLLETGPQRAHDENHVASAFCQHLRSTSAHVPMSGSGCHTVLAAHGPWVATASAASSSAAIGRTATLAGAPHIEPVTTLAAAAAAAAASRNKDVAAPIAVALLPALPDQGLPGVVAKIGAAWHPAAPCSIGGPGMTKFTVDTASNAHEPAATAPAVGAHLEVSADRRTLTSADGGSVVELAGPALGEPTAPSLSTRGRAWAVLVNQGASGGVGLAIVVEHAVAADDDSASVSATHLTAEACTLPESHTFGPLSHVAACTAVGGFVLCGTRSVALVLPTSVANATTEWSTVAVDTANAAAVKSITAISVDGPAVAIAGASSDDAAVVTVIDLARCAGPLRRVDLVDPSVGASRNAIEAFSDSGHDEAVAALVASINNGCAAAAAVDDGRGAHDADALRCWLPAGAAMTALPPVTRDVPAEVPVLTEDSEELLNLRQLDSCASSVDQLAMRAELAVQAKTPFPVSPSEAAARRLLVALHRRIATGRQGCARPVTSAGWAWAALSEPEVQRGLCSSLVEKVFVAPPRHHEDAETAPKYRGQMLLSWASLREAGVAAWIRDVPQLKVLLEAVGRAVFASSRDPKLIALWYVAIGKRSTLSALCRAASEPRLESFFARDFSVKKNKDAAASNGYSAMSKGNVEYSLAFFLLAGDIETATSVALQRGGDWQLALLLARLHCEGDPVACRKLVESSGIAKHVQGDQFARFAVEWSLGEHTTAIRDLRGWRATDPLQVNSQLWLLRHAAKHVPQLQYKTGADAPLPAEAEAAMSARACAVFADAHMPSLILREGRASAAARAELAQQLDEEDARQQQGTAEALGCDEVAAAAAPRFQADMAAGTVQFFGDSDDDFEEPAVVAAPVVAPPPAAAAPPKTAAAKPPPATDFASGTVDMGAFGDSDDDFYDDDPSPAGAAAEAKADAGDDAAMASSPADLESARLQADAAASRRRLRLRAMLRRVGEVVAAAETWVSCRRAWRSQQLLDATAAEAKAPWSKQAAPVRELAATTAASLTAPSWRLCCADSPDALVAWLRVVALRWGDGPRQQPPAAATAVAGLPPDAPPPPPPPAEAILVAEIIRAAQAVLEGSAACSAQHLGACLDLAEAVARGDGVRKLAPLVAALTESFVAARQVAGDAADGGGGGPVPIQARLFAGAAALAHAISAVSSSSSAIGTSTDGSLLLYVLLRQLHNVQCRSAHEEGGAPVGGPEAEPFASLLLEAAAPLLAAAASPAAPSPSAAAIVGRTVARWANPKLITNDELPTAVAVIVDRASRVAAATDWHAGQVIARVWGARASSLSVVGRGARALMLPALDAHATAADAGTAAAAAQGHAAASAASTVQYSALPAGSVSDVYVSPLHDVAASAAWGRILVAGRTGLRTGPAGGSGSPLFGDSAAMPPETVCAFLPDDGGLSACFSAAPVGDSRFVAIAEASRVSLRCVDAPTRALELALPALGVNEAEHHLLVRRVRSSPLGVCVAAVTTVGFVVLWQLPPFCHVAAPTARSSALSRAATGSPNASPTSPQRSFSSPSRGSPPRSPRMAPAALAPGWRATDPGQALEPALSVKVFAETLDACFARDGTAPLKLAVLGAAAGVGPTGSPDGAGNMHLSLAAVDCVSGHVAWSGPVDEAAVGSRLSRVEVVADAGAGLATRAVISVAGGAVLTDLFSRRASARGAIVATLACPCPQHARRVPDCLAAVTLRGRSGTVVAAGWADGSATLWASAPGRAWAPFARFDAATMLSASPRASPTVAAPALSSVERKGASPGAAAVALRPAPAAGFTLVVGLAGGNVVNAPFPSLDAPVVGPPFPAALGRK